MLNSFRSRPAKPEDQPKTHGQQPGAVRPRTNALPFIPGTYDAERNAVAPVTGEHRSEPRAALNDFAWQARLHSALAFLEDDAAALRDTPDAMLLLTELSAPSDYMIRQLPAASRDALALCDDPNVSRSQLSDQIGQDPSLVHALLRSANSAAANAGGRPVVRIDVALDRIGIRAARSIVLANCVDGLLSKPGQPYEHMVTEIWSHMVRTGQAARGTARCFNADVDETFCIALLHDVGKLVVFDQITALRMKLRRPVVIPLPFISELIQLVHEPFGALAAFRWDMGIEAANAIGTHQRVDVDAASSPLAEAVFAAERMDHMHRRGEALDLASIWKQGRLSGSPGVMADQLEQQFRAA